MGWVGACGLERALGIGIGYASERYYLTWNSKFTTTHLEIDSINVREYENNFPTNMFINT